MPKPLVHLSFAPADEPWADRVKVCLACIDHQDRLDTWDRRQVTAGKVELEEITSTLGRAAASVLLISMPYLTDARIKNEELPAILDGQATGKLVVVPLLVSPCPWTTVHWLKGIQMHPRDNRAVSGGNDHQVDLDMTELAIQIDEILPKAEE